MSAFMEKWNELWAKIDPVYQKICQIVGLICTWAFRLRKIVMAAPVVYAAVKLAIANSQRLPEQVGLNLQTSGEFALMVTRSYAVYGCLGVTAFCLLLMFSSRKTIFPWAVSIFSLALPWLIYLTNAYAM